MTLTSENSFVAEVAQLIQHAKQRVAAKVNSELTLLYWQVGQRINTEVLKGDRADYGQQVMSNLLKELTRKFGRGWSMRNLEQMVRFASAYPDLAITQTLSAQLSWSHFVLLSSIEEPLKRDFYAQMAIQERWSTRTLDERIGLSVRPFLINPKTPLLLS